MNKSKAGISLIILGNILYLAYIFFTRNEVSSIGDFGSGILLGLSIGTNLVGIILTAAYIAKEKENHEKENNKSEVIRQIIN